MTFTCDGCERDLDGPRVVFTTEATDESGVDVQVAKRWVTCQECGDAVFTRLDRPSPWAGGDGRTLAFPDDDDVAQAGGFARKV